MKDFDIVYTYVKTSFTQKERTSNNETKNAIKRELARVRATTKEGLFGTQKKHYGLRKVISRIKTAVIMFIFFGIHTGKVVSLTRSEAV